MFQFNMHSQDFAEAMKKIAIAIPSGKQNEEGNCIKMAFYKNVENLDKSIGLLLAFDGKIQAVSSMEIQDVVSDVNEIDVHISGKKALAAANAFAAMDTILEVTIDKEVEIKSAGNKVPLQLGQEIVALKPNEPLIQEIEMKTDEFIRFANFASSCHGEAKGSRGLHCVGIRIDEAQKSMIAVSSNGTRCAYAQTDQITFRQLGKPDAEKNSQENSGAVTTVIEGEQLKNAVKNLKRQKVTVGIDAKRIRIKSGTDVIMILTQEAPFPMDAVLQAIGKFEKKGSWKAPLSKLFNALAIYEITMEEPLLEVEKKGDSQISFHGKDDLTNAVVPCAQEGEVQSVMLNEREFKAALSVFSKDKDIIIETMSDKMPVSIRQHVDDSNRIIVLPIGKE